MPSKRPRMADALLPDVRQSLDDIADLFVADVREVLFMRTLRQLSHQHAWDVEKWRHSSTDLNLLQFAVLHHRYGVVEYISNKHDKLCELDLYVDQSDSQCAMDRRPARVAWCWMLDGRTNHITVYENLVNHPLHMACWLGDLDCLKALTKVNLQALLSGLRTDIKRLMACLKSRSVLTGAVTGPLSSHVQGRPLDLAVQSVSIRCLRFLLGETLPLLSNPHDLLPVKVEGRELSLHTACCLGCPKMVAVLLAAQPQDMHCGDGEGQTPLHLALRSGHTDVVRLLLDHKADVNALTFAHCPCQHLLLRDDSKAKTWVINARQFNGIAYCVITYTDLWVEHQTLTPLHVVVNKIIRTGVGFSDGIMGLQRNSCMRLADYTQWEVGASADCSMVKYMEELVSCLRLLLKAGADPNATCNGLNTLQVVLGSQSIAGRLATEDPMLLFSVVSTLLEFGATAAPHNDFDSLNHFLLSRLTGTCSAQVQAAYLRLFCENGVDPSCMARSLAGTMPCNSPLWDRSHPFWTCLVPRMSEEGFSTLSDFHRQPFTDPDLTQVASSSVRCSEPNCKAALWKGQRLTRFEPRSLMHFCKVATWKALGHQGGGIASLPLAKLFKAYIKSDEM